MIAIIFTFMTSQSTILATIIEGLLCARHSTCHMPYMKQQIGNSFLPFNLWGKWNSETSVTYRTARNESSGHLKLGLSLKAIFSSLYQRRQVNCNSYAQLNALVGSEFCVMKHVEAGPKVRRESPIHCRIMSALGSGGKKGRGWWMPTSLPSIMQPITTLFLLTRKKG